MRLYKIGCGVWGWELELTILRQEEFLFVPACGGEFRSCIQCGVFVCCYDEELFPQAQICLSEILVRAVEETSVTKKSGAGTLTIWRIGCGCITVYRK